ncbi:hypothetical protein ACS0Y7_32495 [Burkholderia gladioli]|uniref:hypothetical protein n=1 Tax=Burkholderia gladioli TaxID=28095 RepID=UPI003F7AE850
MSGNARSQRINDSPRQNIACVHVSSLFAQFEIEDDYNRERLHTSIGFLTPVDYEAALIAA